MESSVLVKTFAILEAMSPNQEAASLASLAQRTGLNKPTVHRILGELARMGYVDRVRTGRYELTPRWRRLARGSHITELTAAAEPILQRLHARTRETVNLGVLQQNQVRYLIVLESPQALRRVIERDNTDPFHCTALGRAIVSHLPLQQQQHLLSRARLSRRTPRTTTDAKHLRRLLAKAKRDGYAVECDETDLGVTCIGSPVFDQAGVVAAISLSAPSVRVSPKRQRALIQAVCQAAKRLSQVLQQQEQE
ncbi:MAG TPA: IclR family transcriptional regulator [Phycisphaeraceae bacterium]